MKIADKFCLIGADNATQGNTALSGNNLVLLDPEGNIVQGQSDLVINAPLDGVITATVTVMIGGIRVLDKEE